MSTETHASHLPDTNDSERTLLSKMLSSIASELPSGAWDRLPTSAEIHVFGDSYIYGGQSAATAYNSVDGALWRTNSEYRIPELLAEWTGRTATNWGINGQKIGYAAGTNYNTSFGQIGRALPVSWSGVAAVFIGWNDATPNLAYASWEDFEQRMSLSFQAMAARLLIDGYTGITTSGLDSNGAADATFSTTGTDWDSGQATYNPFPTEYPATSNWRAVDLTAGQTYSAQLTGKPVACLFYDQHDSGGSFKVSVNGVEWARVCDLVDQTYGNLNYPGVLILSDLPASATVTVACISGTSRINALGWMDEEPNPTTRRVLISGPVPNEGNSGTKRSEAMLRAMEIGARAAAHALIDWPVYYADASSAWQQEVDRETSDSVHPNISGYRRIAGAFLTATRQLSAVRERTYHPYFQSLRVGSYVSTNPTIQVESLAGSVRGLDLYSINASTAARSGRWRIATSTDSESGSNAGTHLDFTAYSDSGSYIGNALRLSRARAAVTIGTVGTEIDYLRHGEVSLVAGTATVTDANVTIYSHLWIQRKTGGGTVGAGYRFSISPGVSFTIQAVDASGADVTTDTSTVSWLMLQP